MPKSKPLTLKDLIEMGVLYSLDMPVYVSETKGGPHRPAKGCGVYKQTRMKILGDEEDNPEVFVIWME